jgi:hypothetical protein
MISALWDDAEKQVLVSLPPIEVVVPPTQAEIGKAEKAAETLTALPAKDEEASKPKIDAPKVLEKTEPLTALPTQWKRRSVPPDQDEEMVTKKAEAHLFLPRDRNKCLDVTSVEEEPNPQPKAARPVPEEAISLSKW